VRGKEEKTMAEARVVSGPSQWRYRSSAEPGFHTVITPENSPCRLTWIFRLNLIQGEHYVLRNDELELDACVLSGELVLEHVLPEATSSRASGSSAGAERLTLRKRDSFYLPAGDEARITAMGDAQVTIGGGPFDGTGSFFVRYYDPELEIGAVRQIHGEPPYQREVFLTVDPETPASRLICGITTGEPGKWTSWPPHQHSADLEEVYCYFDIPSPYFGVHFASRVPGEIEAALPVRSGDCVVIPEGYHPTVAAPGVRSAYYWVMVALRPESRRYDLAKADFF
jgi:5-deoxy-glucuronate isomerase